MKCQACGAKALVYRQCPHKSCAKEIGYCYPCGGDDRSIREMTAHIVQTHAVPSLVEHFDEGADVSSDEIE